LIVYYYVTDYESSIIVKCFEGKFFDRETLHSFKEGDWIEITGSCEYDQYEKDVNVSARTIEVIESRDVSRKDNSEEKRVELHLHSKMSTMDGVSDIKEYVSEAKKVKLVVCNPPFFKVGEKSNLNENKYLQIARHEIMIDLEGIIRKPFFVPESKRIDALLKEFKKRHIHIAIAIDEYGGISGIVCMEDIIEQIVGDIQDEFDNEQEDILNVGENLWLCDARVNIDDLNEDIKIQIPNEEFDTLGGFVFDLFGKIPAKFEKTSWKNLDFIVQDMENHRINQIKVIKRKGENE
jgi:hypothetical protein